MSLVPFNETNNWSVVLRDDSKRAVVLYDDLSHKLSLVSDPDLYARLYRATQARRVSSVISSRQEPPRCDHCGQYLADEAVVDEGYLGAEAAGSSIRNVEYFQILDDATSDNARRSASSISEGAFSQGYFEKFFATRRTLGRGSRGAVYLVEHILDGVSLGLFALKKVPVGDDHVWLEKVLKEVHLLRLLTHPNLVSYNHVWLENSSISTFAPAVPCAYILQEYCNGGTLEDYIRAKITAGLGNTRRDKLRRRSETYNNNNSTLNVSQLLSVQEIVSFMHDIVSGVSYLHQNQIIHRDLKPSNCLMVEHSEETRLPTVLVSDFGEGQIEGTVRSGTGSTGTLEYCAPELIKPHLGRLAQFSKRTDVFSLGMILHFLCFSRLPYNSTIWDVCEDVDLLKSEVEGFVGFRREALPRNDLPAELVEMLSGCLSLDPSQRPDAHEMVNILENLKHHVGGAFQSDERASSSRVVEFKELQRFSFSPVSSTQKNTPLMIMDNSMSAAKPFWNIMKWDVNRFKYPLIALQTALLAASPTSKLLIPAAISVGIQFQSTTNIAFGSSVASFFVCMVANWIVAKRWNY